MKIDKKIVDRLEELIDRGKVIGNSFKGHPNQSFSFNFSGATQWGVSCKSLLESVFGEKNVFLFQFKKDFELNSQNSLISFDNFVAIIKAAKEEYENGYLFNTRTLIEAEIFDEFIEQAEELFKKGYYQAAAIIAGCVLEDCLRKLCDRNSITLLAKATIEPMNVELAKAGIYNKLWQKKITALADLRNKAAHNLGGFTDKDVEDMIRDVRRFMEDYFS
jgi:predicted metal-binding protein